MPDRKSYRFAPAQEDVVVTFDRGISVNTVSKHPTHFLKAVELLDRAHEVYGVPSENWPHPLSYRFGIPDDYYYAEIWTDGMDWQPNYWIIEAFNVHSPTVFPLIVFDQHEHRVSFNDYDFDILLQGMMFYRRDILWIKRDSIAHYGDAIWPYLRRLPDFDHFGKKAMAKRLERYRFQHHSQKAVDFWVNSDFVPERCHAITNGMATGGVISVPNRPGDPVVLSSEQDRAVESRGALTQNILLDDQDKLPSKEFTQAIHDILSEDHPL